MKSDFSLQQDVINELRWEPTLHSTEIGVAVKDGVVTLSGYVQNYSMKVAAENTAKRVKGVRAVAQEITVKSIGSQTTDEDIAHAILNSFKWHSEIPEDKIKIRVQKGWVTLEGQVDWHYQRNAAESAIQFLVGVKGVSNLISVKPAVVVSDVKTKIIAALQRNATLEGQQIDVEAIGTKIILKGKVHSWIERKEAEHAAWAAPGVTNVEDDLVIG
ncbi:BON domain-containing protein [Xanthocytophaga agilis]|uniref:BON domain-containing protein n=1 Tax=Xanthocytophaga agilis TaxID=3048010 RepID=A0AAE3REE8_9BACT|nr:BON domain-containing protein [Xanthocytophaga agilis]MDJ1506438.1 BON domain-containing protein [Xanthocytophaga agilis]